MISTLASHALRPTILEVDLDAAAANIRAIRELVGPTERFSPSSRPTVTVTAPSRSVRFSSPMAPTRLPSRTCRRGFVFAPLGSRRRSSFTLILCRIRPIKSSNTDFCLHSSISRQHGLTRMQPVGRATYSSVLTSATGGLASRRNGQ